MPVKTNNSRLEAEGDLEVERKRTAGTRDGCERLQELLKEIRYGFQNTGCMTWNKTKNKFPRHNKQDGRLIIPENDSIPYSKCKLNLIAHMKKSPDRVQRRNVFSPRENKQRHIEPISFPLARYMSSLSCQTIFLSVLHWSHPRWAVDIQVDSPRSCEASESLYTSQWATPQYSQLE